MGSQAALKRKVAVVGVAATRQGEHPGVDANRLAIRVSREALADAGLEKGDVDGVLGWRFRNAGTEPTVLSHLMGLNPRVTGYLDYGTGGFTLQYAAMLIADGICDVVLCTYAVNPAQATKRYSGPVVYDDTYGLINAGAIAAMGWTRHMALYGSTDEALGNVAVAFRRHAQLNPNAAFREPLELSDYLAAPYTVWPFRDYDIAKATAGAAAIVLTRADRAHDCAKRPVYIEAVGRQQEMRTWESEGHITCEGMRSCAEQCFEAAQMSPSDIDVLAVSDASSASVLFTLEHYGFCGEGESPMFVADGGIELGGNLPVNPDGGQLSGGYLIGWVQQVELTRQLRGECGERQIEDCRVGMYATTGRMRQDFLSMIYTADSPGGASS